MSSAKIGDVITIESLPSGYAQHTIQGYDFWLCFVENITPPEINDGLTLVIAERLAMPDSARIVEIIQDVYDEQMDIPPGVYAESKRNEINEYFLRRFGDIEDNELFLWGAQVVEVMRGWTVEGITLVP